MAILTFRAPRLAVPVILLAVFHAHTALGDSSSARYLRTPFGPEIGVSIIFNSVAQSRDGFLWMAGGNSHLVRFDGQTFYQVPAPLANSVVLAPNGDLWMTRLQPPALIRIAAKDLHRFGELPATSYPFDGDAQMVFNDLKFGPSGTLWVETNRGLYRFDKGKFTAVIPGADIGWSEELANGHLLIVADQAYFEWDGMRRVPHTEIAESLGLSQRQIFQMHEDRHGVIWICTASGVARRVGDRIEKLEPWGAGHGTYRVYEDANEAIWFIRADGVYRVVDGGLQLADPERNARRVFTDRDGQLWIATNGRGLIRLRQPHTRTFTTADGLAGDTAMTVIARADGSIWAGSNCGGISHFDGKRFQTYTEKDGLLNTCVFSLAEDDAHDLWIGTYGAGAFRFHDGVFTQFSAPQGLAATVVTNVFAARDGAVWLATPVGASRIRHGEIRNYQIAGRPAHFLNFYQTRSGVIWGGTTVGLARLDGDQFVMAVPASPAAVVPIGEDESGDIYLTRDPMNGLYRLGSGGVVSVEPQFGAANLVALGPDNVQWFLGAQLIAVARGALMKPRASDEPLNYRILNRDDGLARNDCGTGYPCAAFDRSGRLWVATPSGLELIDLPQMPTSELQPVIYMKEVVLGRTRQAPGRELTLPPGTTHLDLRFDAIDLVAPQKIRLQYRMEGVDREWLDATPPGMAIYGNIPPGTHPFHVRAANRDGVWDRAGVVYLVTQQPHFYETGAFQLSAVALFGLALLAGYRLRIRQLAAQMSTRFDERMNERTRIARELHDTLLQTIEGSKMVADEALDENADSLKVRKALVRLSGWLGQAVQDGRAVLSVLRASTIEGNNLAEAFERVLAECRLAHSLECELIVEGSSRPMHPIVRDEIYRIVYEAIRNACAHSMGKLVRVELVYRHDLTVRVRDDGHGMDAGTAAKGKASHFGIVGMYERAAGIGAKLTLSSSPTSGTVVELVIPGHIVFERSRSSWFGWIPGQSR